MVQATGFGNISSQWPGFRPGLRAEVEVGLLAGDQQELVIGEPAALGEHGGQLGQADRAGVVGVAVAVELGDVDGVDAQPLEDADEVGDGRGVDPGGPLLHRLDGERHVPVAGEGLVAGQLGEAVAVGEAEGLADRVLGRASAQEVEDPQPLGGPGRGVEPGDEVPAAGLGLADPEAEPGARPRWPRPCQVVLRLSVQSLGKKNWCGGGKQASEPPSASATIARWRTASARSGSAVADRLAAEHALGVDPGQPAGRSATGRPARRRR